MAEPYELSPQPVEPDLPGRVIVSKNLDALVSTVCTDLLFQAHSCVRQFGDFHLALSGDPMAEPIYRRLMYDPPLRHFPWPKTHLWTIEERLDEADEQRRRSSTIRDTFVPHSTIPPHQVHLIGRNGERDAASRYARELTETLEWREKGHDRLDAVLLCLAPSGGDALSPFVESPEALVVRRGEQIALATRLLNASRLIGVLAYGASRRQSILRLERGEPAEWERPFAALRPLGGELRWYMDQEAVLESADAGLADRPER